ncbi:MAG: Flp pilus assembly protein CpaB [Aggregatilineales bacterium]
MTRSRVIILIAFIVVILGLVFAFVILPGTDDGNSGSGGSTTGGEVVTNSTAAPLETITPTPEPVLLTPIVVAVQNLRRGAIIPPDAVALRNWPIDAVPENALTTTEAVIGQRARTDIYVEQPILTSMVIPDLSQLTSVGSDLSASIPAGQRAIAVPMDRLTSVAYGIQQGDRVDIILSLLFVEIDEEFQTILPNRTQIINPGVDENGAIFINPAEPADGRFEQLPVPGLQVALPGGGTITINSLSVFEIPREQARPRLTTQLTIQDALVMGVGNFPADGILFGEAATPTPAVVGTAAPAQQNQQGAAVPTAQPPRPDIVTLAVSPQDAVVITYLIEAKIPITFALRSATDTSQVPTQAVTLQFIMSEFGITLPDRVGYSIEPAIRSIRRLVAGEEISLNSN